MAVGSGRSGFGLGLALGVLYVPCAGPVLAAIVLAGATGSIGFHTIALTVSFAIGTAVPLLVFALAGQRVAERVGAFRRRQRQIRIAGGVVMLILSPWRSRSTCPRRCSERSPTTPAPCRTSSADPDQIAEKLDLGRPGQRSERGPVELHGRRDRARKLRHRTGYQGHRRMAQHPG